MDEGEQMDVVEAQRVLTEAQRVLAEYRANWRKVESASRYLSEFGQWSAWERTADVARRIHELLTAQE